MSDKASIPWGTTRVEERCFVVHDDQGRVSFSRGQCFGLVDEAAPSSGSQNGPLVQPRSRAVGRATAIWSRTDDAMNRCGVARRVSSLGPARLTYFVSRNTGTTILRTPCSESTTCNWEGTACLEIPNQGRTEAGLSAACSGILGGDSEPESIPRGSAGATTISFDGILVPNLASKYSNFCPSGNVRKPPFGCGGFRRVDVGHYAALSMCALAADELGRPPPSTRSAWNEGANRASTGVPLSMVPMSGPLA